MRDLIDKYLKTRKHTEELCSSLETEDFVIQAAAFASPVKWNLAHNTWFYEEMILKKFVPDYKIFHPSFAYLFNSYYNSIGSKIPKGNRGLISRPSVSEVFAYRAYVDTYMKEFLSGNCSAAQKALCILGINHEQQHQELLLTDLKFNLFQNPIYPVYNSDFKPLEEEIEAYSWINIPEGIYEIGARNTGFCYDNEQARHKVFLHEYQIASELLRNLEYIEFIEAGGYHDFSLWLDEGWAWRNENNIEMPLYWQKDGETWKQYTLSGLKEIKANAALTHVSFYEADAFARWKGLRLASEFEWEVAADNFKWGKRWEWTNSAYLPYPKFKIAAGAVGEYNGKFMVNQMVLRGASVATSEGHSRKTYRNFFHPHLQWQFSGIRLAK